MKITLCGSARFESHFKIWNEVLSLAGHTVYSLAVYPSDKRGIKVWYTDEEKETLDRVHKQKIENSDAAFILNVFGYVGPSTLSEIEFAVKHQKQLYAIESWGKGFGIGAEHHEHVYKKCHEIIPDYQGASIDFTTNAGFMQPWDLLPEAGSRRTRLVEMLNDFREDYLRS